MTLNILNNHLEQANDSCRKRQSNCKWFISLNTVCSLTQVTKTCNEVDFFCEWASKHDLLDAFFTWTDKHEHFIFVNFFKWACRFFMSVTAIVQVNREPKKTSRAHTKKDKSGSVLFQCTRWMIWVGQLIKATLLECLCHWVHFFMSVDAFFHVSRHNFLCQSVQFVSWCNFSCQSHAKQK